jgi:hypothetical protein
MSYLIGKRVNVGIAKETTRGVGEQPTYWLPWTEFTFDDKIGKVISEEALGNIEQSADQYTTEKWGEGEIVGEVRDKSFGLLMYALLGAKAVGANGTAYDHTFTLAQTNQHQSLCIHVDEPNGDYMFELAMINQMELTIETGKLMTYNCGFMSCPSQTTSIVAGINSVPALSTLAAENKFIATNAHIRLANDRNNFGPAPVIKVQSLKITFSKNLFRKHVIGSLVPDDIYNQAFAVEGTLEMPYNDKIYKSYDLDNTYKAMEVTIENRSNAIGGAGVYPKIKIILPRVGFFDWTPKRPVGTLYEQTIGFRAFRDVTNNENSVYQIVLTNGVATY